MSAWQGFGNFSPFWGVNGVSQEQIGLYNIYQTPYFPYYPETLQNQYFFSSFAQPLITPTEDSYPPNSLYNPAKSMPTAQIAIVQSEQRNENRSSSVQNLEHQGRKNKPTFGRGKHSSYYWNAKQHTLYCEFLKANSEMFRLGTKQRKNMKINVMMSKKVKTRSPIQCHTHHQKMIKKYGSIEGILREKFGPQNQTSEDMSFVQPAQAEHS